MNGSIEEASSHSAIPEEPADIKDPIPADQSQSKAAKVRQIRQEKRLERYGKVMDLHRRGYGIRAIARQMQIDRCTVRKYIQTGEFPEMGQRQLAPSKLDPYHQYLKERWEAGCQNRLQLWHEIQEQGFLGSCQLVYIWAKQRGLHKETKSKPPRKQSATKSPPSRKRPWSASRAVWLLLKDTAE